MKNTIKKHDSCCSKNVYTIILEQACGTSLLKCLKAAGFTESEHMTKAGILYAESQVLIVTGDLNGTTFKLLTKMSKVDLQVKQLFTILDNL